ncbi:MAG: endonuclease/exonuclease/phosphatase family protein [Chthonomonadaceae bacterium]|nr:endonuclease/exonuclease/phosphatase family protein [Chthonomonadaceae bacterium]
MPDEKTTKKSALSAQSEKTKKSAQNPESILKRKRMTWILMIPTVFYLLFLVALAYAGYTGPERWWWTSLNLYLPQWIWAIPGVALILLYLLVRWRWVGIPLLLTLWVITAQMGFVFHLSSPSPDLTKGTKLRLMTYNIKAGRIDNMNSILEDIRESKPDVILFQEAHRGNVDIMRQTLYGWNVEAIDQYLIASQLPITKAEMKTLTSGDVRLNAMRCTLTVHNKPVTVYTVHLHSPRSGLVTSLHAARRSQEAVTDNTDLRLNQAKLLADYLRKEATPMILTGDLNAPVQSEVCQELEDIGLRDAFSAAGRGYGYTYGQFVKVIHMPYLRIDHIMLSADWTILKSWPGNKEGSEHRPVFADVYLPH